MKYLSLMMILVSSVGLSFPDAGTTPVEKAQQMASYKEKLRSGTFDIDVSAETDGSGKLIEVLRTIRSANYAAARSLTDTCARNFIDETLSAHTSVGLKVRAISSKHQVIDNRLQVVIRVTYEDPSGRMNPNPSNWQACSVTGIAAAGF